MAEAIFKKGDKITRKSLDGPDYGQILTVEHDNVFGRYIMDNGSTISIKDQDKYRKVKDTRLVFKVIKGKPVKHPEKNGGLIISSECTEVQYNGHTHLRIKCPTPLEFKNFHEFLTQYIGTFPAEMPYIYIPKDVLVQQPKGWNPDDEDDEDEDED